MFAYLEKFKKLPPELRQSVSAPSATAVIDELEKKYGITLDALVIKIMVKEVPWSGLRAALTDEHNLSLEQAEQLQADLAKRLFHNVTRYLGITGKVSSGTSSTQPQSVDERVDTLIPVALQAAGISDTDSPDALRLKNSVKIFCKGIRDAIDTRETLMKAESAGGLGLDAVRADAVIGILKGGRLAPLSAPLPRRPASPSLGGPASPSLGGPASPLDKLETMRDAEYVFKNLEIKNKKSELLKSVKLHQFTKEELAHELPPPPPAVIKIDTKAETAPQSTASPKRRRTDIFASSGERARMNDILQPPSKLQGPLEELAGVDLTIWRRLGDNPAGMAAKIESKIALLAKESNTRRQQGVNAWRQSPLYREYLALGQESFIQSKPIEDIIKAKSKTITIDEFNAIVELNNRLRV